MKFIPLTLSYLIAAVAKADVLKGTSSLFKDDQNYWKRLLAEGVAGSVTSPPTVKDSENPSPSPSDLPSSMTKSCLIEVSIACTDSKGVDCASITGSTTDCDVEVTYEYTLANVGSLPMLVTELQRTYIFASEAASSALLDNLIDLVDPKTIDVGLSVTVTETRTIDTCIAYKYSTTIDAKADPPEGLPCESEDIYDFSVTPPPTTPPPTPVPPTTPPPTPVPPTTPPPTPVPPTTPPPTPVPPTTPPPTPVPPTTPPPNTEPPNSEPPVTLPPVTEPPLTFSPTTGGPSALCFAQVDVECVPPINPEDPNGERFEDCDSINIAPAECTEFVYVLTFRFNGGDCLQSNNIQDPRIYQCEDYFGGPPSQDETGAESFLIITDIKGQGINYYNGPIIVGDTFNITNILPNEVIVANVNATFYDGEPSAENIRQTMVIHTSCSQVTFLKDRYGALELIGFGNPSQGYLACIVPVSFNFAIQNTAEGFNAEIQTLTSITNFDPPNDFLNFTSEVAGQTLGPGDSYPVVSGSIDIDLSVRKRYTVFTTVQGASPDGFSCRGSDFTNFTAGQPDTRPTFAPAVGEPTAPAGEPTPTSLTSPVVPTSPVA